MSIIRFEQLYISCPSVLNSSDGFIHYNKLREQGHSQVVDQTCWIRISSLMVAIIPIYKINKIHFRQLIPPKNLHTTVQKHRQSIPSIQLNSLPPSWLPKPYSLFPDPLVSSLILNSSSLMPFPPTFSTLSPTRPSSCVTVFCDSGASICPWRRKLSLCHEICPPSASRCFCALRFAAPIDVRAYLWKVRYWP